MKGKPSLFRVRPEQADGDGVDLYRLPGFPGADG